MSRPIRYCLSLDPALETFRPEIEFVCRFLDHCHEVCRGDEGDVTLHYGISPVAGAVHVPAVFFPDCVRIDDSGIWLNRDRFATLDDRLVPRAIGRGSNVCPYDSIGLIFFLLSRVEERGCLVTDRHGRFPVSEAFSSRFGLLLDPPADRAVRDVAALLTGISSPPSRTQYSVRLTHDVDRLKAYHRPLDWVRPALGDVFLRRQFTKAGSRILEATRFGEPWQSFRRLMAIEETYGLRGHYYFMGPSALSMDSPYAISMRDLLSKVSAEVRQRGHEVGFHPGYATADNAEEWRRQRFGLESIVGGRVIEGRQHVLRYQADLTADIWDGEGMEYDCTLAYPDASGFRTGSCRPFQAYSLKNRRPLRLKQGSTAICDFALLGKKYRDIDDQQAFAESDAVIDACRRYGGEIVMLFHTGLEDYWYCFFERLILRALDGKEK